MKNDDHFVLKAIKERELPRVLYKYRSLGDENTEKIITESSFWFAEPKSFNDPFDCNLSEVKNHKPNDLIRFLKLKKGLNGYNKAGLKSIVRDNSELVNSLAVKARKKIFGEKGLLSLSMVHDDILMWSHYSLGHTGIVIALDLTKDPDFFVLPIKVKYEKSYIPINSFIDHEDDKKKFIYKMFATKSKQWDYEKEVRISKEKSGLYSIKSNAICKVYFGCEANEKEKNHFIELCKVNNMNHLKFYQATTAYGSFSLIFKEIKT